MSSERAGRWAVAAGLALGCLVAAAAGAFGGGGGGAAIAAGTGAGAAGAGAVAAVGGGAAGAAVGAATDAEAPRFDGKRAMALLERQCALGPRPPGSPALERLRKLIEAKADSLGLRHARLCFDMADPYGGPQLQVCNLVVSAGPRGGDRLWFGAHYDTRPRSDRDPDPARHAEPLLGANDGASGVAVLLHLAELLSAHPPERGVDLLFFDAEDYGREGDLQAYCIGSRHLARTWRQFGNPLAEGRPQGLVLLDMVGEKNVRIPMEGYSLQAAPDWTRQVFDRAAALGLDAFVQAPGAAVYDDHVPFLEAGIPSINLIDFQYPQWHTTADTPAACSPASLEQVGRLVVDLVYRR